MAETHGHLGSDVFYDFEEMSCGDLLIALMKAMRPLPPGLGWRYGRLILERRLTFLPGAEWLGTNYSCAPVVQSMYTISSAREELPDGKATRQYYQREK